MEKQRVRVVRAVTTGWPRCPPQTEDPAKTNLSPWNLCVGTIKGLNDR